MPFLVQGLLFGFPNASASTDRLLPRLEKRHLEVLLARCGGFGFPGVAFFVLEVAGFCVFVFFVWILESRLEVTKTIVLRCFETFSWF